MTTIDEQQLKTNIAHIFESGANEERIFNMVKDFTERRGVMPSFEQQSENRDSQFAFPMYYEEGCQEGLTKREYFAGLAMQGLMSNSDINQPRKGNKQDYVDFSYIAVKHADELIKALNEK